MRSLLTGIWNFFVPVDDEPTKTRRTQHVVQSVDYVRSGSISQFSSRSEKSQLGQSTRKKRLLKSSAFSSNKPSLNSINEDSARYSRDDDFYDDFEKMVGYLEDEFYQNGFDYTYVSTKPTFARKWKPIRCKVKAKFQCGNCGHKWTSMKVWIHVWVYKKDQTFHVNDFGQECDKCHENQFESPIHYEDEISRSARWVVKVISTKKGKMVPRGIGRDGKMNGSHKSGKCEACRYGVCSEGNDENLY